MRRLFVRLGSVLGLGILYVAPSGAAETINYTYDAKGRLVKVEHSGAVNNGLKSEYSHDKANNRRNLKISGSPNPVP